MKDKTKITFVINEGLQKELHEKIVKENYGFRGKSKWISEAIELLLNMDNYPELVNFGDELKKFEKVETIVIENHLKRKLDEAIIRTRKVYPILEGVQSRIVRTAIIQRLIQVT